MADIDLYLDKFDESGRRVLEGALDETRRRNQNYISPAHIVYALMTEETELFNVTLQILSIEPQDMRLAVEKRLENSRKYPSESIRVTPETTDIFKSSMDKVRSENRRVIAAGDICFALANKTHLLNDILQNPKGDNSPFNTSGIKAKENQIQVFTRFRIKPSKFFDEFSLKGLVNQNTSTSSLLFEKHAGSSSGSGGSGGNSEQATHSKHESLTRWIEAENFNKFDEKEYIFSLKKDVENSINRSGLEITETNSPNSSSFSVEYEVLGMKGQINISGAMKDGHKNIYYELTEMILEKNYKTTK